MAPSMKAYLNNVMAMAEIIRDISPDTERGGEIINLCNDIIEELDRIEIYLGEISELDDKMTGTKEELEKLEKRVKSLEKFSDWAIERICMIPEKYFSCRDW